MRRRLIVARHAEASTRGPDHDRPQTARGRRQAGDLGRFLAAGGRSADAVVASSALRARQTAEIAVRCGASTAPVELSAELYGADAGEALAVLSRQPAAVSTLLLVGHEPSCSRLLWTLTGVALAAFPVAALAAVALDSGGDWSHLEQARGELDWLRLPARRG